MGVLLAGGVGYNALLSLVPFLTLLVGALVYFFANLSMVNVLHRSLATVIVVLLSLEIVFVILLLGAQVIAELEASSAAGVRWYEDSHQVARHPAEPRAG